MAVPGAIVIAALVLALSAPAMAAPDCATNGNLDQRLCAKFEQILEQQEESAMMISDIEGLPQERKDALVNQSIRGMAAHGRSNAGEFIQLARDRESICEIAEVMGDSGPRAGDDDGICKGNEDCQELIGDGIGDDDGICRTKGKPTEREVCVEFCSTEGDPEDPDAFDQVIGDEIEASLDDLIAVQDDANEALAEVLLYQKINRATEDGRLSASGVGACAQTLKGRPSGVGAALAAKILAEQVNDGFWVGCQQDAAGFNTSGVCLVTTIIKATAVGISETLSAIDGNRDSDAIDATWSCAQHLSTEVADLKTGAEEMEAQLDDMEAQLGDIQAMLIEVEALLNTPIGRRPGFPEQP